jgi:tetratricopeptide (TPR) repeat protein
MPSLQALRDFKASFDDIGGERAALEEQNIPFEDLPFPEIEAEIPDTTAVEEAERAEALAALSEMGLDPSVAASLGLPQVTPGLPQATSDRLGASNRPGAAPDSPSPSESIETAAAGAALGDIDLDALLGSIPEELGEIPEEDAGIPTELLDGFADDVEESPRDTAIETDRGEAEYPETGSTETNIPELNLDDLGDLALDGANLNLGETDLGLEGLELGGEAPETGFTGDGTAEPLETAGLSETVEPSETTEPPETIGAGGIPEAGSTGEDTILGDLEAFENLDGPNFNDLEDFGNLGDLGLEEGEAELGGETSETGFTEGETAETPEIELSGLEDLELEGADLGGEAPETGFTGDGTAESPEPFETTETPEAAGAAGIPEAGSAGDEIPLGDLETFENLNGSDFGDPGDLGLEDAGLGLSEDGDTGAGEGNGLDLNLEEGFGEEDLLADGGDSFDAFDVDETPPPEEEEGSDAGMDLGDFTLPGIDDMLGGIPSAAPQKPGKGRKSFFSGSPAEETVEEIRLDETDLTNLRRTLASYPLNLRLAVEEIIAERAVPPEQMGSLVRLLIRGALPRETAALAGKILNRTIQIPRGFQKKTGEQLEAEQGSFAYIFVHNFLPILRLFLFIALTAASSGYLIWRFIYTPIRAENIYRLGYERIAAGEYERANQRFSQAFDIRRDKKWFYRYAEAFRDQRQYLYAEEKYDELLRWYPRDKKGTLDYAAMETYYRRNYEKADLLLRRNILEYDPNDPDALLAQGDNALAWGEIDPSHYEDARFAYARLLDRYGWTDPVAERMLRYFIRTDNLKEVIPLQFFFMDNPKKKISAETLAELGGYLLDKRTEEVRGVPNEYREQISGVRDLLLRAVLQGPDLPEAHYHLSRYYRNLGSTRDEQLTLEVALRAFDGAAEESVRREVYHIEALKRDAEILTERREYFKAEEQLVKAIGLYENIRERRLLAPAAQFGQLYAAMGDLEYFTKSGDMEMSLTYYLEAEKNGYAPPEMLYRMGAAHYQREEWAAALERFFVASLELPLNRRLLLALGNTCYQRGDFYAAQGYYNRLLDLLEAERSRLPVLLPNDRPEYIELAERLMIGRNNLGATLESLARSGGGPRYLAQAGGFYAQAVQAWDALTRNPQSMVRLGAGDLSNPGASLPYLNSRNILYPQTGYEPQLFVRIDRDVLEPSPWED